MPNTARTIHASGNADVHVGDTIAIYQTGDRCLPDLRITDPRDDKARIEDTKGGLFRGSYCWILDHDDFLRWRHDEHCRLLWIKGDPGKGKTMLLCGIIDELRPTTKLAVQEADTLLSFFFCQATDSRINNATAVLRGLIYLFVKQQPSLVSHVQKRYKDAGKPLFEDANAWTALSEIFTCILDDISLERIYLIIDALDECETGLEKLLKLIVHNTSLPRVKWIISSRNRYDIERQLKLNDSQTRLSLELGANAEHVSHAVGAYIDNEVSQLKSLEDGDTLRDYVRHVLHEKADGTFLWVALVVQELEKVDSWDVRDVVDDVPKGLDEMYDRMMKQIRQLERKDPEFCQLVLSAATLAYRPLHLLELGVVSGLPDAIASRAEDIQKIVKKSGSFLTVREGQVFIIHQSAKDYLEANYILKIQPTGPAQGHADVSRRSVAAMSSVLKQNIYSLSFGFKPENMRPPDPDPLVPIRYSCVFWADHLSRNGESPECKRELTDDGAVFGFLRERFLRWLESLSLLGDLSYGSLSIQKLLHVVQESGTSPRLAGFLEDAEKFVRSYGSIIERAPLQTYGSALVFSPTTNEVRKAQWKERLSFIGMVEGVREHWDAYRQTLHGHSGYIHALAFSPDGKTLVSASGDRPSSNNGFVRLWDAATGAHRQTLDSDSVHAVAFSPDGKTLASASNDRSGGIVQLWDAASGAHWQTLEGHGGHIAAITFSPDGKMLAAACLHNYGSSSGTVQLWDATVGTLLQTLKGHCGSVNAIGFSPDGKTLALASALSDSDFGRAASHRATRYPEMLLDRRYNSVSAIAFSLDNKTLASASGNYYSYGNGNVKLWDVVTVAHLQTLEGHSSCVNANATAFSLDCKPLTSAWEDRGDDVVWLWDATTGARLRTLKGYCKPINAVAFSPDSKTLASASGDSYHGGNGTIQLWDVTTGAHRQTLVIQLHKGCVNAVTFSPDNRALASASGYGNVQLWDVTTVAHQQTLTGHSFSTLTGRSLPITAVAFSPDGKRLASGSGDGSSGRVQLWDVATGAHLRTLGGYRMSVNAVAFSLDGRTLASASGNPYGNGIVQLWDTATWDRQTLEEYDGPITAIIFSADSKMLASTSPRNQHGSYNGRVRLLEAATGAHLWTLNISVTAVTFSLDGKTLALASGSRYGSGIVQLRDAATGAHWKTLEGYGGFITAIAFSPDGKTLAAACNYFGGRGGISITSRTVQLWDATIGTHLQTFKGHYSSSNTIAFSPDGKYLITSHGSLQLPLTSASNNDCCEKNVPYYGLSISSEWITLNGKNLLWLPEEYRPTDAILEIYWLSDGYRPTDIAVYGNMIVIGHRTGKLTFLQFKIL